MFRFDKPISREPKSLGEYMQRVNEQKHAVQAQQQMESRQRQQQIPSQQSQSKSFLGKMADKVKSSFTLDDNTFDAVLQSSMKRQDIANYFNNQSSDNPTYEMTVRQKSPNGGGSKEWFRVGTVDQKLIQQIQERPGSFIEGHARTNKGLVRDIYDSDHPDEIRCDHFGQKGIILTSKLADIEEARRDRLRAKAHSHINIPEHRVVERIDVSQIPMAGHNDGDGHGGFGE